MALSPKQVARSREMDQQIAYLRWKKMQNDREIKKAITVSRALKKKDEVLNLSTDKSSERYMWAHSVVHDELQRPLVLNDADLYYLQSEEVKGKKRLAKYSEMHMDIIDKTLTDLQSRNFHSEVARTANDEKIQVLTGLKHDVSNHLRKIKQTPAIIDTKTPIPKLFS